MHYDTESNIAWWELSSDPITQAKEFGNLVIHFSALGKPVLIEMLNASKFLGDFEKAGDNILPLIRGGVRLKRTEG